MTGRPARNILSRKERLAICLFNTHVRIEKSSDKSGPGRKKLVYSKSKRKSLSSQNMVLNFAGCRKSKRQKENWRISLSDRVTSDGQRTAALAFQE
jgi:hypothetical protein